MEEQRKFLRQKSYLRGCIYFNNRSETVDCFVRDISGHGARLTLVSDITIPDAVDLHIPQRNQTYRANVLWRRGAEMGLAFAQPQQSAPPSELNALHDRIRKLEQEAELMRRTIRRLQGDARPRDFEAA